MVKEGSFGDGAMERRHQLAGHPLSLGPLVVTPPHAVAALGTEGTLDKKMSLRISLRFLVL